MAKRALSEEEEAELRVAFGAFDANGDGSVSSAEVGEVVRRCTGEAPTPEQLQHFMAALDKNQDGVVEWHEFKDFMQQWLADRTMAAGADKPASVSGEVRKRIHASVRDFFVQFNKPMDFAAIRDRLQQRLADEDNRDAGLSSGGLGAADAILKQFVEVHACLRQLPGYVGALVGGTDAGSRQAAADGVLRLVQSTELFLSPEQRLEVAPRLVEIFDKVQFSGAPSALIRILYDDAMAKPTDNERIVALRLQVTALQALRYLMLGPRFAHLPIDSPWHPARADVKQALMHMSPAGELPLVSHIAALTAHACEELREEAGRFFAAFGANNEDARQIVVAALAGAVTRGDVKVEGHLARTPLGPLLTHIHEGETKAVVSASIDAVAVLCGRTHARQALSDYAYESLDPPIVASALASALQRSSLRLAVVVAGAADALKLLLPGMEGSADIVPLLLHLLRHTWPSKEEGARAIAACLGLLEAVILADGRAATAAVAERDASLLSAISVILSSSDDVTERLQAVSMRVLTAVADKGHREPIVADVTLLSACTSLIACTDLQAARVARLFAVLAQAPALATQLLAAHTVQPLVDLLSRFQHRDHVLAATYAYVEHTFRVGVCVEALRSLNALLQGAGRHNAKAAAEAFDASVTDAVVRFMRAVLDAVATGSFSVQKGSGEHRALEGELRALLQSLVELHRPLAATDRLSTVVVQTAEKALAKWDSELDTALRRSRLAASRKASASGGAGGSMDEEDEAPSPLTSITQFAADGSGAAAVRVRVELGTIVRKFEMPRTATLAALWGECTRLFGRQCTPCAMNADGEFAEITSDEALTAVVESAAEGSGLLLLRLRPVNHAGAGAMPGVYGVPAPAAGLPNMQSAVQGMRARGLSLPREKINRVYEWFRSKGVAAVDLALFRVGMSSYGLPPHSVDRLFRAFDADGDGTVSLNELICGLSLLSTNTMEERVRLMFVMYDVDKSGFLEEAEVGQLVAASLGLGGDQLRQYVSGIFQTWDKDGDRRLSFDELRSALMSDPQFAHALMGAVPHVRLAPEVGGVTGAVFPLSTCE